MRIRQATGRVIGALGLFVALTLFHTWPLGNAPSRAIHSAEDVRPGMWWLYEAASRLLHEPSHVMDGGIFYPFSNTLAILDHQFSDALMAVPLVAAGVEGVPVYNYIILATFVLSGLFTYLLVRRLTGSTAAGLVAGCLFAFSGYRADHLTKAHLLATQWLPLSLLMLHRYVERPTWSRWAALTVVMILLALSSWHLAIIGAVGVAIVTAYLVLGDLSRSRRALVGLGLTAIVCGVLLLPLARAYMRMGEQWPPRTEEGRESVETLTDLSANLVGLIVPSSSSLAPYRDWFSRFGDVNPAVFPGVMTLVLVVPAVVTLRRLQGPPTRTDRVFRWALLGSTVVILAAIGAAVVDGPGGQALVARLRPAAPFVWFGLALAAVAVAAARRAGPIDATTRHVLAYTVLAVAGALLALGPRVMVGPLDAGSGLWRFDLLPVRLIIRAPERLSLLLVLGTSVLAGFGVARLIRGRRIVTATALTAGLLVLVNVDLRFSSPPLRAAPAPTFVEQWLAQEPEPGAVIDYPLHWTNWWAAYAGQRYGRRTVNGTGYLIPAEYAALENQPDLSPGQVAVLWEQFHPRFAIVRTELYAPDERARVMADIRAQSSALVERARFGSDYIYEIRDQGRGTELLRWWPYGELSTKDELVVVAQETAGRPDTVGELAVSLNGHLLLEAPAPDPLEFTTYRVPFTTDWLEARNFFALSASYRFTEAAERHEIGTTGVQLAADVTITADRFRSVIVVNGRIFRPDPGYFLVAIEPASGRVLQTGAFDVSSLADDSGAMAAFIDNLAPGTVVALATESDASASLTADAVVALSSLGMTTDLREQFRLMHAAIGVKGAVPGTALEVTGEPAASLSVGEMDAREIQLGSLVLR